jgi:hypothetical protein
MAENNFHADLVAALSEIPNPPMTQVNPHFRSKFSSLKDCVNTIKPILSKHGIAVTQMVRHGEAGDRVVTRLVHKSGDFVEDGGVPLSNTSDPQKMGSSMTYARRYGLLSICGVVGDPDDDGNKASEPDPVVSKPIVKDDASDYVLSFLDARTLSFDNSKGWVDAYTLEMRKLVNDTELTPDERMTCMKELEEKNAETLNSLPPGVSTGLKDKRLAANKKIGAMR